jgi:DNA repair exonuclease SbcCD ATPase subunit
MEKARDKMLDLSMRQEKLWQESQETDPNSPRMKELAEEQENLRQAMKRIQEDMNELAKKSLAVTPKLQASIDETLNQMQAACNATQERDARTASHYRKQALAALNETLKQQNQACSQCQSQCNKPSSNSQCNKAGGMCQKQGQINSETLGLMNNPGSLSQQQQASMQRLAGEQEALSKSMEQLSQEAQASKQSLGRLDDLAQEMKDVAEDLRRNRVTQSTIQRQEKIESRLLDFQRANREREFSPQRKSNTGIDVVRASPQKLPDRPGQEQLREDLLRALETQYSPDYEELIRKYFDALSKWQ